MSDALQEIEADIQQYRGAIDRGAAVDRLFLNRDFRLVILSGYLEKEAVRLVHLKADPAHQEPHQQKALMTQLDSIGCLAQYLKTLCSEADQAKKGLDAAEPVRDALLAEG